MLFQKHVVRTKFDIYVFILTYELPFWYFQAINIE
jgi:hypothetical protein